MILKGERRSSDINKQKEKKEDALENKYLWLYREHIGKACYFNIEMKKYENIGIFLLTNRENLCKYRVYYFTFAI